MTDWMFLKRLDRSEILCNAWSPIAEATDNGLNSLLGMVAKCNCLGVLGTTHQLLHMKSARTLTDPWAVVILVARICTGWRTWLVSMYSLGWLPAAVAVAV